MSELPGWADYTVTTRTDEADFLEAAGRRRGLRITHLGGGLVALEAEAFRALMRQPEPGCAAGVGEADLTIWIQGCTYFLDSVTSTQRGAQLRPGQALSAAGLAIFDAFPLGATPVPGTVTGVTEYPEYTAVVVSVPGSGMRGEVTTVIISHGGCRHCHQRITLLGGMWTGPDGGTCCTANLSAAYTPHQPA